MSEVGKTFMKVLMYWIRRKSSNGARGRGGKVQPSGVFADRMLNGSPSRERKEWGRADMVAHSVNAGAAEADAGRSPWVRGWLCSCVPGHPGTYSATLPQKKKISKRREDTEFDLSICCVFEIRSHCCSGCFVLVILLHQLQLPQQLVTTSF